MSLRLLIDEDSQSKPLVKILREAGHDVVTVNEVEANGQPEPVVLNYARENDRILLTHNCGDFEAIHLENPNHPEILAVYREAAPSKNMSSQVIVKALANLEAAMMPLANQFIALNHWNY